jgi:GNAT superfamily N-acetyltransferase
MFGALYTDGRSKADFWKGRVRLIRVTAGQVSNLGAYAAIPISYVVESRLVLDRLWLGEFEELPIGSYEKDYDSIESVASLPERFDMGNWGMLLANSDQQVGGAIVAWKTHSVDMLEGREDLAILWDIRVAPVMRGKGIGRALFEAAKSWAKERGCTELRVETQDINVAACRFYKAVGCELHSIEAGAYLGLDEAKILWTTRL